MSAYSPTAVQRSGRRPENASPVWRSGIGSAASQAVRWLYPQAPDVVQIERRADRSASGNPSGHPAHVSGQVAHWRRRVWQARAAVVLGRHLSVALGLTVVGLLVARLATSVTDPLWVFAGAALMLVACSVALSMPATEARVAGMLDSDLGLFERVQTALELERIGASSPLGLQVIAEAQQALASSFGGARARSRHSRAGLAALAVLVIAVALLVVLPGSGQPGHASRATGANRVGATGGTVAGHHAAPAKKRPAGTATLPVGASVDNRTRPPLAIAPSTSKQGKGGGASLYGNGAKSTGKSTLTKTGLSHASANARVISAPGSATGLAGSKSSSSGSSSSAAGSSSAKASAKAGSGGLSAPGSAPTIRAGSLPKGARAGGTPGSSSGSGAGSQSGSQSQKAPPGGEQAGATRGSTQLQAGLTPSVDQGSSGLPLQAGYAPAAAKGTGHGGISQTPNGGGGKARSATGGSASGGSGSGSGATAIQPTANTSSSATQAVLSNYFGSANQLKPGSW